MTFISLTRSVYERPGSPLFLSVEGIWTIEPNPDDPVSSMLFVAGNSMLFVDLPYLDVLGKIPINDPARRWFYEFTRVRSSPYLGDRPVVVNLRCAVYINLDQEYDHVTTIAFPGNDRLQVRERVDLAQVDHS